jgi:hypothetical protein
MAESKLIHGVPADRVGTQATAALKMQWPKFDVNGAAYDKAAVTRVQKKGTQLFAVVPAGQRWQWPEETAKDEKKGGGK